MTTTVFQFCNKCNCNKPHFFATNDTLECRACHKSYRVATSRQPLEQDQDLTLLITTGANPMEIKQPKALIAMLKGARR